ncbi:hypothetical protein NE237_027897 [Protea cynaroides]|uniref:Uncharacterized protein n=1 Tax=Protea cynaroides TaxID=273540 RepID=A0A9Q0JUM7_9MAGN|nr:hypothetical protein NE237_027897 [Protea cynaroides]
MAPMWVNKKRLASWSDYGHDLGMSRSRKKTARLNHGGPESTPSCRKEDILDDAKSDLVHDADYKLFLTILNVEDEPVVEEENDIDPDYKIFLDHLKADEKSYTYEMKKEDGKSISIKYEKWDGSFYVMEKGRIPFRDISSQEKRKSMLNEEIESEPSSTDDYRPFSPDHKHCMEMSQDDDSYAFFLSNLRQNGESMILEYGNVVVRYESDDESEIDSEVEPEFAPYCSGKKFCRSPSSVCLDSSMDEESEDGCSCIEDFSPVNISQYREKLVRLLQMPYNEQEYRDLKDLAHTNKRLEKTRDLRGRLVSYQTDETSLSYFDHFADFKEVFDSIPSLRHSIRLNLLRGFFYYLKHLSHEGSFKPWLDKHCLKIKPGSN